MSLDPGETEPLRYTGHLLRRAQQVHLAVWQREVSRELSSVQFAALTVLDRTGGTSQAELGAELFLDRSTVADVIIRMVRRGLLAREQNPDDRRRKIVTLTDEGRRVLDDLRPRVAGIEAILTAGLDARQRADLRHMLHTMLREAGERGLIAGPRPVGANRLSGNEQSVPVAAANRSGVSPRP
jgi:MarR family transcriptional regulator, temperature-dependent positive regulator of motility